MLMDWEASHCSEGNNSKIDLGFSVILIKCQLFVLQKLMV